jgi:very-short-patch-repair endonuclease
VSGNAQRFLITVIRFVHRAERLSTSRPLRPRAGGSFGHARGMDDWLPPLPDETPRVLTRADAARLGYSANAIEHRLRTGQWRRVLPRTFLTSDTFTWRDRCRAALAFAGPDALLSGAAALADTGLTAARRPETILVLVPPDRWVRSTDWVRIHRTSRFPERALRPGPACAPVARAVADLARERRRLDDVRALVAEVVRREHCTIDELIAELASGRRNDSGHLRKAIEEVAGGAWSAPEARAARLLRAARVPPFKQNVRIDLPDGKWFYVDFLWKALRAVLEIDSDQHHALPADADATDEKDIILETMGFSVVHRRPYVITHEPAKFTSGIAGWLAGRAAELA